MTSTPASQGVRLGRSSKSCATRLAVPTGRLSTSSTKVCGGPEGDTDAATHHGLLQTSHQRPGATDRKATGQPSAQGQVAQLSAQSPALVNPVLLGSFIQPNPAYQRPTPASQSARIATDHVGKMGQWVRRQGRVAEITSSTVTVRFGSIIYTYDEKGMTIYSKAA